MSEQSERPKDRVIIEKVVSEWRQEFGSNDAVVTATGLLVKLLIIYGDMITVGDACAALNGLVESANLIREHLMEEKAKS